MLTAAMLMQYLALSNYSPCTFPFLPRFLFIYSNYKDSSWILLITNPAGDHFQTNMQQIWTLNLQILKIERYYNDRLYRTMLTMITGNLVSQTAVSCSTVPVEKGVSDTVMVYYKEILSTLRGFSIIAKRNKDRSPVR